MRRIDIQELILRILEEDAQLRFSKSKTSKELMGKVWEVVKDK